MKRRPPKGNVRRVQYISGNIRTTYVNKAGRTHQCESFQEYKLAVMLDRDPTVKDSESQPLNLTFRNSKGQLKSYTPDFMVWRIDGSVEIHEVTVEERRQSKPALQEREENARQICVERGWKYVIHTDETLPTGTEWANLDMLIAYRPEVYADDEIIKEVYDQLQSQGEMGMADLIESVAEKLSINKPQVCSTLLHLLWHNKVQTNLQVLLFIEASPNKQARIWKEGIN